MILRLFALFLLIAPCADGQAGLYGKVTSHPKAGDLAPDLVFDKVLSTTDAGSWNQASLAGRITVLGFFPDTTDNLEAVKAWNAAVDRFAGKPVQFVWITGEAEATVVPWLVQHPIKGWVLEDADGKTGNAYGMEIPSNVIVGADRKIAGYYSGVVQTGEFVHAVQDGRATTARPTKATLKAFMASKRVLLDAEPRRMPQADEHRPKFAPSYAVHVTPSDGDEHSNASSDDFLSLRGYTVKEAFEELYGFSAARLQMPAALDAEDHYDFEVVLPGRESRAKMRERLGSGMLEHFHLAATRATRMREVYVLTSVPGRQPPVARSSGGGFDFELESIEAPNETDEWKPVSLKAVRGVSSEGTLDEFCHQFEANLDRPVINETKLKGTFNIGVKAGEVDRDNFVPRLRDEMGLVLTPAERDVDMLVIGEVTP